MISATVVENCTENTAVAPTKRKQFWVVPEIQGRFIGWLVAISTVIATTVSWAVLLLVWAPLRNKVVWIGEGVAYETLYQTMLVRVLATTGMFILLFGTVSFLVGLLLSHKVAGPLHRLGRVATEASRGATVDNVVIRENDYIHDFADEFNGMVKTFQARESAKAKALNGIERELSKLEFDTTEGRVSGEALAEEVRESLQVVRDILQDVDC